MRSTTISAVLLACVWALRQRQVRRSIHSDGALHTVTEAALRTSAVAVLAIVGELDWARPDAEHMVSVLSDSQIEIIPGANHVSAVTHPLFLRAAVRFLAAH